ncbi:MAG: hypothetical protein HY906_16765 [Deltaproteobacteria bacterium]|nr:hypothetical protein [Deltaproteobacteria bacterium]
MPRILFLHGLESSPGGRKATWLAQRYGAHVPALTTSDWATARAQAEAAVREYEPDLIVGSSFGGALLLSLLQDGITRARAVLIAQAGVKYGLPPPAARGHPRHPAPRHRRRRGPDRGLPGAGARRGPRRAALGDRGRRSPAQRVPRGRDARARDRRRARAAVAPRAGGPAGAYRRRHRPATQPIGTADVAQHVVSALQG